MPSAKRADLAFWDSSGLVLLCTNQRASHAARRLATTHGRIAYWWGAPIEVRSALTRLSRERVLLPDDLAPALGRLASLRRAAAEVLPNEEVRLLAESAIDRFEIRAADAMQLAAAMVVYQGRPAGRPFVCFDARLSAAASLAGFGVLPHRPT